jgi:hypothetical protein
MPSEFTSSIGRFGLIAAGGYAFGPIGAAAGALIGGFLFGSSGPKIEGRALATSRSAPRPMAARSQSGSGSRRSRAR